MLNTGKGRFGSSKHGIVSQVNTNLQFYNLELRTKCLLLQRQAALSG